MSETKPVQSETAEPESETKGRGRPRSAPQTFPIYTSMQQCAAETGLPEAWLKIVKRRVPAAFRWNRVDLLLVLQNLALALEASDSTAIREEYQAKNEKLKYEKVAELFIEKEPVAKGIHAAEAQFFGALDRLFLSELPPHLANKTAPEIRAQAEAKIEELKTVLRNSLQTALNTKSK